MFESRKSLIYFWGAPFSFMEGKGPGPEATRTIAFQFAWNPRYFMVRVRWSLPRDRDRPGEGGPAGGGSSPGVTRKVY